MRYQRIIVLFLVLPVVSCQLVGSNDDPFLITSSGVGDLEYGMTRDQAAPLVGEKIGGAWTDGIDGRFWFSRDYEVGAFGTLTLHFLTKDIFPEPLLDKFTLEPDFLGKSTHGIGIGSTIQEVERFYRTDTPQKVSPDGTFWVGPYCLDGRDMSIQYEDGVVIRMTMGYYFSDDSEFFGQCATAN